MNATDAPIEAIPTTYKGIQLRSRMEAQCALLFDTLEWDWQYEPNSLMLTSGVAYTPDFFIKNYRLVIECRGYDSQKGNLQLDSFRTAVMNGEFRNSSAGDIAGFSVIGPDRATYCNQMHGMAGPLFIGYCDSCEGFLPHIGRDNLCGCKNRSELEFEVGVNKGRIFIRDAAGGPSLGSEEWASCLSQSSIDSRLMDMMIWRNQVYASRMLVVSGRIER